LRLAGEDGSPQVSAFVPGVAEPAPTTAMEHGMRITFPMVLMSTRAFGTGRNTFPGIPVSCNRTRRRPSLKTACLLAFRSNAH
jgi:hypothetical protein